MNAPERQLGGMIERVPRLSKSPTNLQREVVQLPSVVNKPAKRRPGFKKDRQVLTVPSRTSDLIAMALGIEETDVRASGQLGFMSRAFTQTTLPHSKMIGTEFERSNGIDDF